MVTENHVTSYLWGYEERRWKVSAVEYQVDTVVAVDGLLMTGENMTE